MAIGNAEGVAFGDSPLVERGVHDEEALLGRLVSAFVLPPEEGDDDTQGYACVDSHCASDDGPIK